MNASSFVKALAAIRLPNVFNPYADTCAVHDRRDGPAVRRRNLRTYLAAAETLGTDTAWMGRDLGYRGGRRTGLALTDEAHLPDVVQLYPGCQAEQATKGALVVERTAAEIWAVLHALTHPPVLWNVFPLHPHKFGDPMTNRRFSSRELTTVDDLNATLITWLGIRRVVGIGQDAAKYAKRFGVKMVHVRHPSYGGTTEFRQGMQRLYDIEKPIRLGSAAESVQTELFQAS